jgi:hypothetical protein
VAGRHQVALARALYAGGRPTSHLKIPPLRASARQSNKHYSTGLLVSTFSAFGGSDLGGSRLDISGECGIGQFGFVEIR